MCTSKILNCNHFEYKGLIVPHFPGCEFCRKWRTQIDIIFKFHIVYRYVCRKTGTYSKRYIGRFLKTLVHPNLRINFARLCSFIEIEMHAVHNELKHGKSPFWQENALFVSKAKINVFWKIFKWTVPPQRIPGVKNFFQKMLILVF